MIPKSYTEEDLREKFKVLIRYLLIVILIAFVLIYQKGVTHGTLMHFQIL